MDPGLDGVEGDLEGLEEDAWGIDDGDEMDKPSTRASIVGIRKTKDAAVLKGWSSFASSAIRRGEKVVLCEGIECQLVCL